MKKYSNDNIFLNSSNDIIRNAYHSNHSNLSIDKPPQNISQRNHDTNIFLNQKEEFNTNNNRINDLNSEILSLKSKLKFVYEKDEEIKKHKMTIEKLKKDVQTMSSLSHKISSLETTIQNLIDERDTLKLSLTSFDKLKQENKYLKTQLHSSDSKLPDKNSNDISDKISDDISDKISDEISDKISDEISDEITIDISQLKSILCNRLKDFHEKHIDNLILQYDIQHKTTIPKNIIEKLLLEAIHL